MYMTKLRATLAIGIGLCSAALLATASVAKSRPPEPNPPEGPTLSKQQGAPCHTTNLSDPIRQGPSLFGIIGRRVGSTEGFHYSADFAKADFVWDEASL